MEAILPLSLIVLLMVITSKVLHWLTKRRLVLTIVILWGLLTWGTYAVLRINVMTTVEEDFFRLALAYAVFLVISYFVGPLVMKTLKYPLRVTKGALLTIKDKADGLADRATLGKH